MKVVDIMTKNVITIQKEDSIIDAAKKMKEYDIGFLVVTNLQNEVLGVLTDRDIVIRCVFENSISKLVDSAMTHDYIGIDKNLSIEEALKVMSEYQLKRLVVVDKSKLAIGVLSLSDIARSKYTNKLINETLQDITTPNPQKEKPLKYLKVDDFPL